LKWQQIDSIIQSELYELTVQPPQEELIEKVKTNLIKNYEENLTGNIYWLSIIDNYYFNSFDSHTSYLQVLACIKPEDIQDFVKALIDQKNHIEIIMLPEEANQ
jgi:zinc protease